MTYFSVVIPLYNKKQHIKRALDSVLAQTHNHFEIIVVDDGSSDGGEKVVKYYPTEIKLITQNNQGVSIARNTGILHAQHEYICLLDADDEWKPNFLEEMATLIELYPKHNIYSARHEVVTEYNRLICPRTPFTENFRGIVEGFIDVYRNNSCLINSSSVCLKKSFFHKLGGFPAGQTQGEDVYLWLLYALNTDLVFTNIICSRYYKNSMNRSTDRLEKLPFQFFYFYGLLQLRSNTLRIENNRKELLKYLRKDALLHIADLRVRKKTKVAKSHASVLYSQNKRTGLLCFGLMLFPSALLRFSRDLRNFKKGAL